MIFIKGNTRVASCNMQYILQRHIQSYLEVVGECFRLD